MDIRYLGARTRTRTCTHARRASERGILPAYIMIHRGRKNEREKEKAGEGRGVKEEREGEREGERIEIMRERKNAS